MIENFNNLFKDLCCNLKIGKRRFVLGLSGGIDSMALLSLVKNFLILNKNLRIKIFPVIIDHNLRSNSASEANRVLDIAKSFGFKATIKKINIKKPSGNIQNWARKERRRILCDMAFDLSASLLLGHHSDDQAETIFMRSIKSSGIDGLVGMQEKNIWNGISIFRPLIHFNKDQITKYVEHNNVTFFQDNSNFILKYERNKVRKILKDVSLYNWPNISEDLIKFSFLNKQLLKKINNIFAVWIENNTLIDRRGAIRIDFIELKILFKMSNLFTISIIGKVIKTVGGKEFSPKREKTLNCLKAIFCSSFKKTNLGNVNIYLKKKYLFFIRENRNINFAKKIIKNKKYIFDGRFILISNCSGNLTKSDIKDINFPNIDNSFFDYQNHINNTIPCISTLEGTIARPHLINVDIESKIKSNADHNSFDLCFINRLFI